MAQQRMTADEFRLFLAENARKKPHKHRNRIVYIYEDGFVANEKSDVHGRLIERYDSGNCSTAAIYAPALTG